VQNRLCDDQIGVVTALDYAQRSRNLLQTLSFLVSWPALNRAANLVLQRSDELDGDHCEVLTPAADALSGTHPLATTVALRAMIDFSLKNNRSSRYRYAARHLIDCSSLASAGVNAGTPWRAYPSCLFFDAHLA
jgi:hypothetical protein